MFQYNLSSPYYLSSCLQLDSRLLISQSTPMSPNIIKVKYSEGTQHFFKILLAIKYVLYYA